MLQWFKLKKSSIHFIFLLIGFFSVDLISVAAHAADINPTPQQIEQFKNLPPDLQQKLIDEYLKNRGGSLPSSISPSMATSTATDGTSTDTQDTGQTTSPEQTPGLPIPKSADQTTTTQPAQPAEPSTIEKQFRETRENDITTETSQRNQVNQDLSQFGYDLFSGVPTTFAPATDIPIPADYVVGPGDTVIVQLFGKDNAEYEIKVKRDGTLPFPGIGPIPVAGLKFSRLQSLIKTKVHRQMIGNQVATTLGRLRSIRVFVLGDVERPGSYTVSGLSTLTNALFVSGGVKKRGSLRNIQLKRNNKVITTMDLYDLLLKGDTKNDRRLLPGDVIFVPPIGKTVAIGGEVKRPAIYELKKEKTLSDIVSLAGGLLPNAYSKSIQVERINKGHDRTLLDYNLTDKEQANTELENGDFVRVFSVLDRIDNAVVLEGHVQRPGGYQWKQGMHLTDLIPSLNVLLPEVDAHYVLIEREHPGDRTIELLDSDLAKAIQTPDSLSNIALEPRDTVYVFSIHDDRSKIIDPLLKQIRAQSSPQKMQPQVSIFGTVHHAGKYPLTPGMTVSDLIRAGGGTREEAYTLEAELTRTKVVDEKVRKQNTVKVNLASILAGDEKSDLQLQPYDELVIRPIPEWYKNGNVTLQGEFKFPGSYPIKRGEKLSEVLKRAGGLTDKAYPKGSVFLRTSVKAREEVFIHRLADQLQRDLSFAAATPEAAGVDKTAALAEGNSLLKQLRSTQATGRMVINVSKLLKGDEDYDLVLQDGDELYIPQRPDDVAVLGEVYHPTAQLYQRGNSMKRYIKHSGGVTKKGDKKGIYVVHADGSVNPRGGWFHLDPRIGPGDTIIVPLKLDRISGLKLATDVTQVMYQITVSLATLRTLGVL